MPLTWAQIQSNYDGAMTAAKTIINTHDNRLEEPGFELSGTKWQLSAGASIVTTDTPKSGLAHLRVVTLNGTDRYQYSVKKIFPSPGELWYASGWAKASVAAGSNAAGGVDWYDINNTYLSTSYFLDAILTTSYVEYTANVIVPESTFSGLMVVGTRAAATSSINVFFDDIVVRPQTGQLEHMVRVASELNNLRYLEGV